MTVALAAHTANHGTGMLLAIGLLVVLSVLTATVVIADLTSQRNRRRNHR